MAFVHDLRDRERDYFGGDPTYEEISQLARQVATRCPVKYETAAVMPLAAELVHHEYAGGDYAASARLQSSPTGTSETP